MMIRMFLSLFFSFFLFPIHIESANYLSSDTWQIIVDRFFASKNMSSITLPRFHFSEDDSSCVLSLADVAKQSYNFLTKCSLSKDRTPSCLNPNWAVKMLDALPTKPSGLSRRGPLFFLGDYDLCKSIWKEDRKSAQYCRIKGSVGQDTQVPVTIGLCLPLNCGEKQILSMKNAVATSRILRDTVQINQVYCSDGKDHDSWTSQRILVGIFGALLIGLVTIGTIMEKLKEKGVIHLRRKKGGRGGDDRSDCGEESIISSIGGAPSIALTYRSTVTNFFKKSIYTIFIDVVSSFSIRTSIKYLFRNSAREIPVINGIRVVAAYWVIFAHTSLFSLPYSDTVKELASVERRNSSDVVISNFVINSSLAVDTFLFVSALVATYSIRKRMIYRGLDKSFSPKTMLAMFAHRIVRLIPSLCIYLGFMTFVYNHLSDGPFWNEDGMFGSECNATSVWPHFVFLSNILPSNCAPWLWHVSLDFQLYLLVPVCFFFLCKFRWGWLSCLILSAVSICYRVVAHVLWTLPPNMFIEMLSGKLDRVQLTYRLLYTSPFSRAPPFLMGILTGWYMCSKSSSLPIRRHSISIGAHLLVIALLSLPLFGPFSSFNVLVYAHSVLHRTCWAAGLAVMCALYQRGSGGVWKLLGSDKFVVLSRLSLGVYLSHEPILLFYLNTLRQPMSPTSYGHFSFLIVAIYVFAVMCALAIALIIEIPLITMERKFLMRAQPRGRRVSFSENVGTSENEEDDEEDEMDYNEKTALWLQRNEKFVVDEEKLEDPQDPEEAEDDDEPTQHPTSPLEIIKSKLDQMSATSC